MLVIFDQIQFVLILPTFCKRNHSIDFDDIFSKFTHNTGILVKRKSQGVVGSYSCNLQILYHKGWILIIFLVPLSNLICLFTHVCILGQNNKL